MNWIVTGSFSILLMLITIIVLLVYIQKETKALTRNPLTDADVAQASSFGGIGFAVGIMLLVISILLALYSLYYFYYWHSGYNYGGYGGVVGVGIGVGGGYDPSTGLVRESNDEFITTTKQEHIREDPIH